jgi:hypothetical protein
MSTKVEIKSSILKLLLVNLFRVLKEENCIFTGSFCDFVYTDMPLMKCKDIDLCILESDKLYIVNKLLHSKFYIQNLDGYTFAVKPYNTYPNLRNFRLKHFTKSSYNQLDGHMCISLNIFSITIDCFIYGKNHYQKLHSQSICLNNIRLLSKEQRTNSLEDYAKDTILPQETRDKHSARLSYYNQSSSLISNLHTKLDRVITYNLPKNFFPETYLMKNKDLQHKLSLDGAIDHYCSHGIFENRNY